MNCKNMTIKLLIAIFVFLPLIVKANDYCTVVSGDGKSIGSEIACGEEHFYIIDSDDNNVKMLTKYNLYAGQNYTVLTFTEERWNELMAKYGSNLTYLLSEPEFDGYDNFHTFDHVNHSIVVSRDLEYDYKKIVLSEERWNEVASQYDIHYYSNPYTNNQSLYYDHSLNEIPEINGYNIMYVNIERKTIGARKRVNDYEVKQSSIAIGAHGDTLGQPEYPEYGVFTASGYSVGPDVTDVYSGGFRDTVFELDYSTYNRPFQIYLEYLENYGFEDIDLMSIKDLNRIVQTVSNRTLPLEDWLTGWQEVTDVFNNRYNIMGSFKEYLPAGYEWLYSTTYWTKSFVDADDITETYDIFVDTLGNMCNAGFCNGVIGAGHRPVLTLPRTNIIYNIEVETNNNGTVEVVTTANGGEEISFVLKSRSGYKLKSLVLKDADGNTVVFDEVSVNDDGDIVVNTNKFTMPLSSVRIIANWEEEEETTPDTPTDPDEGNNNNNNENNNNNLEPMNGEISTDEKVPITGDNIVESLSFLGISIMILTGVIFAGKKNNKKKRLIIE